jgi:hydrogenase 3 maturation protease
MKKKLVLTVGNEMMGDDAAGPLLARMMERAPLEQWDVLRGGNAPENHLWKIREIAPDYVLVVDAADMDLEPGQIRLIGPEKIQDPFLMTTHTLPLSYLMESLREFVPKVEMVGIQPQMVAFGFPLFDEVRDAVKRIYEDLKRDEFDWESL